MKTDIEGGRASASMCHLKPEYTFERFIRGEGNLLACAASIAVAESPANAYNPLFIYGGVGLGKTHLLHAIGNFVSEKSPWRKVIYITSERFAIDLVNAIQTNKNELFRRLYRQADVLLIDDVHFLKDKEATQEELFHTFNELYENNKQIVLSSDRSPESLNDLQDRLVSRFRWGLVADIQPPNLETRLAILRAKAQENRIEIAEDLLMLIAKRIHSNVRALEGALIRAIAYSQLHNKLLTPQLLAEVLPHEAVKEDCLDINAIKEEVARQYEISVTQLEGESREKQVSQARHIAIYLARELTQSSFPALGKAFGSRDHTTIMHAYQKIKELIQIPLFRNEIDELKERLLSRFNASQNS